MAGTGGKRQGAGRKKGVPNRITSDLRSMVLGALDDAGGKEYLTQQARDNPGPFLSLVSKCLPKDVKVDADVKASVSIIIKRFTEARG